MGFHEGASELSGGFLGVDIFFVLSGFLITDLLVTRYDTLGRLDLRDFWTRRARRLLPALAVMTIISVLMAGLVVDAGFLRLELPRSYRPEAARWLTTQVSMHPMDRLQQAVP